MAEALFGLAAALIGALIGGLLSMVGAASAEQRVLKQSMRVRMYDEILPKLRDKIAAVPTSPRAESSAPLEDVEAQVRLLYRTATIAGRADQTYVERMQELLKEIRQKHRDYHTVMSQGPHPSAIEPIGEQFLEMDATLRGLNPDWSTPEGVSDLRRERESHHREVEAHQSHLASFEDEYKKAVDAFSQQVRIADIYLAEKIRSIDWGRVPFVR